MASGIVRKGTMKGSRPPLPMWVVRCTVPRLQVEDPQPHASAVDAVRKIFEGLATNPDYRDPALRDDIVYQIDRCAQIKKQGLTAKWQLLLPGYPAMVVWSLERATP